MDEQLMELISRQHSAAAESNESETELKFTFVDDAGSAVEFAGPDGVQRYAIKPMAELYGKGTGATTVDPKDDRFMPLMVSIEEAIASFYQFDPGLTDGQALLAVKEVAMSPEAEPSDPLAQKIARDLRMTLSLNDYSRQEVRGGLRHVVRSIERHTRSEGRRGYLNFIQGFFSSSRG